jgi:hypothetical protein
VEGALAQLDEDNFDVSQALEDGCKVQHLVPFDHLILVLRK